MHDSSITIRDAQASFTEIKLAVPLTISGGTITTFSLATVTVTAVNKRGKSEEGSGASIFSIPWSWPQSTLTGADRDEILRRITTQLLDRIIDQERADPIQLWRSVVDALPAIVAAIEADLPTGESVPHLAAMLAVGAIDNAIHDAWGRVAGRSCYTMYTSDYLNEDLASVLGADFAGVYPGQFLAPARRSVPIQHLVSPSDPLPASANGTRGLTDWLSAENPRFLKVKVLARDPVADARRVSEVYQTALLAGNGEHPTVLAVDPNEGYQSADALAAFLDAVEQLDPHAAQAIAYVEQPTPRHNTVNPQGLRSVGRRVPILMDEGLSTVDSLLTLPRSGFGGAVIKAGKGQTFALLVHSFAHAHDLYVTIQDLTAVDIALQHSIRLSSVLDTSSPHCEYNSRQYAPEANRSLSVAFPDLVTVADGHVTVPLDGIGIY